jgi:hypothetical protein
MANKMTKREKFERLLAMAEVKGDKISVEFIEHELELLAKKNSADKKPTKAQEENKGIKDAILDGMEENRFYTITEIMKEIEACKELSNQRVSALVRQLKQDGLVIRKEEKGKAYFTLA